LEDDIIQQVSMASIKENENDLKGSNKSNYAFETDLNDDEREMALALEMSQWDVGVVLPDDINHLSDYTIPNIDEDTQLRATMEESLRYIEPKNSNISNYEYKSSQNYNNDDDDEDLRRAIEESLRYK
jgi:predicted GNAT superfamily acetyltransferase